jgi:hypothetical protein
MEEEEENSLLMYDRPSRRSALNKIPTSYNRCCLYLPDSYSQVVSSEELSRDGLLETSDGLYCISVSRPNSRPKRLDPSNDNVE